MKVRDLAKMIDHSLLHPTMTERELRDGCEIAKKYSVAAVFIKPYAIPIAVEILEDTDVMVGSVIGFPHGATPVNIKVFETEQAIQAGAVEIDMVVNVGKVLDEDWDYIRYELGSIREVTKKHEVILKVIFENDYLNQDRHKIKLSKLCSEVQVDYIKTSTGYGFVKGDDDKYSYAGATDNDLRLMRKEADSSIQVKAAGGVKNLDDLLRVRELGCTRVGATATVEILEEAKVRFGSEY